MPGDAIERPDLEARYRRIRRRRDDARLDRFDKRLGRLEDDVVTLKVRLALMAGGLAMLDIAGNVLLALFLSGHLR